MIEFHDTHPDINVPEKEFLRLLGYPGDYVAEGRVKELMDATRRWFSQNGKAWIYVRQAETFEIMNDSFVIDRLEFKSKRIVKQMRESQGHSVVLAAVSAGKNCEEYARQLWQDQKPDEYFFMEVYGSAVVEHLITGAAGKICAWADRNSMAVVPRYSPGYPDWDILEQQKLYDVIVRNQKFPSPVEIQVLQSGMLKPKKSLLSLFGLTRDTDTVHRSANLIPCHNCSLKDCQYRRGNYNHGSKRIDGISSERKNPGYPLPLNARYSFNHKALEKWSKERLRLQNCGDGRIEAVFRYEGTTCSNMGHALEFEYRITIGSPENEYTIISAECAPASGDTGHKKMCQYLEDPNGLMNAIADEKPMIGKPLNDILSRRRDYHPSACYCRPAGRDYKWGLVLEVIHYALAKHENGKNQLMTSVRQP